MTQVFTWLAHFAKTALAAATLAGIGIGIAAPALAANELAVKTLTDQARFWQSKGRGDLAADAWKKLLQLDPNHIDALSSLAQFELDNNRLDASRGYTERLKQLQGSASPVVRRIETGVATKNVDSKKLQEARTEATSGKFEEAARTYRQVLGSKTPSGPLALEYYQTLGSTEAGWDEARQGLARLNAEDPSNRQVALAYGQHLSYRGTTRRDGIRLLSQLAKQPDLAKPATESWRKALIWLEASKADASLFQAYLSTQSDPAVRSRLDSLMRVEPAPRTDRPATTAATSTYVRPKEDPNAAVLRDGFSALNSGDLEQAAQRFEKLLKDNPNNSDALGGLGVIRLKQERFADAETFLNQATKGGQNMGKWGTALNSARFWKEMATANGLREANQNEQALEVYASAQRLDPTQPLPSLAIADLLAEQGKLPESERNYRRVLEKEPTSLDAQRGLINVMAQQGRIDDAAVMAERLSPEQREKLGGYGTLKAEQFRRAALAASERGDSPGAIALLEDAMLWDPTSPWLRLELGRLYQAAGSMSEARAVVDGLLVSSPNAPNALYASALMSAEAEDWFGGLDQLERIPVTNRTKDMLTLQRRLWVRAQAERAGVLARSGQTGAARQMLRQTESAAGKDGELLGVIAQGYSEAGDDTRALATIRALIAQNNKPDLGMMVQYSAILLKTQQDAELATQMRQLYAQPLTERQRNDLDNVRVAYSLRQFDALREIGNIAAAYEVLTTLLTERPEDVSLQLALARLYGSAREYKDALAWYDYALQREPDNLDALVAATGAALAVSNLTYAEGAIHNALQIAPDNPTVLSALGKLYRAQGKTKLATQTFQRALIAEQSQAKQLVNGPLGMKLINYTLPGSDANLGVAGQGLFLQPPSTPLIPRIAPPMLPGGRTLNSTTRNPVSRPVSQAAPAALAADGSRLSQFVPVQYTYPGSVPLARPLNLPSAEILPVQNLQPLSNVRPGQPLRQLQMISNTPQVPELAAPYTLLQPPVQPALQTIGNQNTGNQYADGGRPSAVMFPGRTNTVAATKETMALADEIDELNALGSGSAAAGGAWRTRSGDAGSSSLSDFTVPVETRFAAGEGGHMVLRVTPVLLDAGQIGRTDLNLGQRFGTNAFAASAGFSNNIGSQQATGIGFGVGYESLRLKIDVGNTPAGFKVVTLVGGAAYSERFGDMALKLDLSRRSITDSLLSYAGTVDERTGTVWGGVTATGGRAELSIEQGQFGAYGYGSYHYVGGKNVADNNRYEGGAGAYYKMVKETNMELTTGISVTALGYDKNLRYFTLGQGGYFSPQRYFSANLPIEWTGRYGALSYRLDGSIGIQSFRENSSAYFPNSTALQTAWESAAAAANATAGAPSGVTFKSSYPGQSKTGLGFRLGAAAEYRIAPKWVAGGKLALDNASDYFQASGLLYVRYNFEPSGRAMSFPPNTLRVVTQ